MSASHPGALLVLPLLPEILFDASSSLPRVLFKPLLPLGIRLAYIIAMPCFDGDGHNAKGIDLLVICAWCDLYAALFEILEGHDGDTFWDRGPGWKSELVTRDHSDWGWFHVDESWIGYDFSWIGRHHGGLCLS